MKLYFTSQYTKKIADDAKKEFRPRANLIRTIILNNLYNFNDSEIKGGKKPKPRHNTKLETVTLADDEYNELEKIAKHYNMTPTKLVAFIINQYYEEKENE